MADLVYPGALHTRFEHVLGTLHVADRIVGRLDELEQVFDNSRQVVRLAALLHDIGHGPFSHVSEYVLDQYYDTSKVGTASIREKIHEKITVDIVNKHAALQPLMNDYERAGVTAIIRETQKRSIGRDIVSSALDADKMDYLLRDGHYAGVDYGIFDLDKVVDSCRGVKFQGETYLMISDEGLFAIEQLVIAKHHMFQQVYGHRIRQITDAMIVRGLELAIEANDDLHAAYTYDGSSEHLERYLALDDARVADIVLHCSDERARELYQRLRDRRLYKQLAMLKLDTNEVSNALTLKAFINLTPTSPLRTKLEAVIAEHLKLEPWQIIVQHQSVSNPVYRVPGTIRADEIYILERYGSPRTLNDYPEVLWATQKATDKLLVIGPRESYDDLSEQERHTRRNELEKEINELILRSMESW
jgi:uncharacterized protein